MKGETHHATFSHLCKETEAYAYVICLRKKSLGNRVCSSEHELAVCFVSLIALLAIVFMMYDRLAIKQYSSHFLHLSQYTTDDNN